MLDGLGIERAHVVGQSMGGALAQLAAARHPARVATLTLISTSPMTGGHDDLPGPDPRTWDMSEAAEPDWGDPESLAEYIVADARALSSTRHPFDENGDARPRPPRPRARRAPREPGQPHAPPRRPGPDRALRAAARLHGTADPLFPIAHGEAFGGELVRLEGGGHVLHPGDWDQTLGDRRPDLGGDLVGGPRPSTRRSSPRSS